MGILDRERDVYARALVAHGRKHYGPEDQTVIAYVLVSWMFIALEPTDRTLLPAGSYPEWKP